MKQEIPCVRYADDLLVIARSMSYSERLLESSTKYQEMKLNLTVIRKKNWTESVFAIRNFKFLGFVLRRNGRGINIMESQKSQKSQSLRKEVQIILASLEKINVYMGG